MKKTPLIKIVPIIAMLMLLFSCKKEKNTVINDPAATVKLKTIINDYDTFYLTCTTCPPTITQQKESFIYDNMNRLEKRIVTFTMFSPEPVKTDTTSVFTYHYNDNGPVIDFYTELTNKGIQINHLLTYDSQKRILIDSVTNPQESNNKISLFSWGQDTVIVYERQISPGAAITKMDTLLFNEGNVVEEKMGRSYWAYTLSNHINPLSYVNNFSLLGSDLRNGINFELFRIYTPQYITQKLTIKTDITFLGSSYKIVFDARLDTQGRIESFTDGYKRTSFEYY